MANQELYAFFSGLGRTLPSEFSAGLQSRRNRELLELSRRQKLEDEQREMKQRKAEQAQQFEYNKELRRPTLEELQRIQAETASAKALGNQRLENIKNVPGEELARYAAAGIQPITYRDIPAETIPRISFKQKTYPISPSLGPTYPISLTDILAGGKEEIDAIPARQEPVPLRTIQEYKRAKETDNLGFEATGRPVTAEQEARAAAAAARQDEYLELAKQRLELAKSVQRSEQAGDRGNTITAVNQLVDNLATSINNNNDNYSISSETRAQNDKALNEARNKWLEYQKQLTPIPAVSPAAVKPAELGKSIRVIKKETGEQGTLPEDEFDPNLFIRIK